MRAIRTYYDEIIILICSKPLIGENHPNQNKQVLNLLKKNAKASLVKTVFVSPELVFVSRAMSKLKIFAKKLVL